MLDPKVFYRELDSFLAAIRIEESDQDFLLRMLCELEVKFGPRLNFGNSRIYEQRGDFFALIHNVDPKDTPKIPDKISTNSDVVQLVYKNRSYIFDTLELCTPFFKKEPSEYTRIASIWVHNPELQWLFVFELKSGWIREETSLFLNSVRTSLNYRLFSDFMGGRLEQAALIQKSLLPQKPPDIEGYDIAGRSSPAELVGGDLYDYFMLDEGSFGVCLGDASGHGLPAALLVRDVVIGLRMGFANDMRLLHTVKKLNQVIQKSTYSTNFVSLFIGEIESDGHLFYANAGHPAPFIVKGKNIVELEATGITLGFIPNIDIHRSHAHLEHGSVLVMYSDGIIERTNKKDEQYELERLHKLVVDNQQLSAKEINQLIFKQVFEYGGATAWEDDASVVVIKRL